MLFDALARRWPVGVRAKFLLLPGGFISAPWPALWDGCVGWNTRPEDSRILVDEAKRRIPYLLTKRVLEAARGKVDAIVFGIDFCCDAETDAYAELVVLSRVATGSVSITGKSLPYSTQRTLVRFTDLRSHFVRLGSERVMLLGCHDLSLFSPRARKRQTRDGILHDLRKAMDGHVAKHQPTVVLQLPHGTDTAATWKSSWNALLAQAPTVRSWASGISFYNPHGRSRRRSTLKKVLERTRGETGWIDLIYDE